MDEKKFTICSKIFDFSPCMLYSFINSKEEVMNMDLAVMKKLNRQGLIFVGIHSLVILNFAFELMLLH